MGNICICCSVGKHFIHPCAPSDKLKRKMSYKFTNTRMQYHEQCTHVLYIVHSNINVYPSTERCKIWRRYWYSVSSHCDRASLYIYINGHSHGCVHTPRWHHSFCSMTKNQISKDKLAMLYINVLNVKHSVLKPLNISFELPIPQNYFPLVHIQCIFMQSSKLSFEVLYHLVFS